MKNKFIWICLLFALCVQVFAQAVNVDISSITVAPQEPGFFKPGETMTITVNKSGSSGWTSDTVFMMIVLSKDNTISNDDHLLEINGNSLTMKPFSSVSSNACPKSTTAQQTYNYNFQVPAGLTGDYYIIVRVGQKRGVEWGQPNATVTYSILANPVNPPIIPNSVKTNSIQVEFTASKSVVFNTATVGDKSSRAKLIIVEAEPPKQPTSPDVWLTYCKYEPAEKIQKFGEKQSIEIKALDFDGGDILYYFISPNPIADGDSLKIKNQGKSAKEKNVSEEIKDADTIYVGAYVTGGEKEPSVGVWKFVRDTLKAPTVNPYVKKIAAQTTITVNLNNETGDLCDFEILYTTDGSDPLQSANKLPANRQITIDKSTTLRIVAVAYNRIHSPENVYEYVLATDGNGAYFDTKGKGGVDKVVINTTIPVKELPESAQLTSPFKNTDKKTISKSEMRLENDETIIIEKKGKDEWIFPPLTPYAETNFETGILGQLFGDEYGDNENGKDFGMVTISDSIAPVPIAALYVSGKIDLDTYNKTGKIETDNDTLTVTFSEATHIIQNSGDDIFEFSSNGIVRHGIRLVRVLQNDGLILKFEVKLIDEKLSPAFGDTLYVFKNKIRENKNVGGVTQESETSVALTVAGSSYFTLISTVTPIVSGGSDPTIVIDFIKKSVSQTDRENLNIGVKIIDATGNIVAELDGFTKNGNISAEIAENALQIRIRWSGKNRSGRSVGAGAYLAVLSITGPDGGAPETVFKTIGVGTKR